jgi:hypothetical protein
MTSLKNYKNIKNNLIHLKIILIKINNYSKLTTNLENNSTNSNKPTLKKNKPSMTKTTSYKNINKR